LPSEGSDVCNGADGPGGLTFLVDGVVLGKQEIMLGALPIGQHEILLQVIQGPVCHTYKQIEMKLSSACEYDMMGGGDGMCVMEDLSADGSNRRRRRLVAARRRMSGAADSAADGDDDTSPIVPDEACGSIIESSAFIEEMSWQNSNARRRATSAADVAASSRAQHEVMHGSVRQLHDQVDQLKGGIFLLLSLVVAQMLQAAMSKGQNGNRACPPQDQPPQE